MSNSSTFCNSGEDFSAFNKAITFLKEAGFAYGSMQRGAPIGIMLGDYHIEKWRNLDNADRAALHGTITTLTSFREGNAHIQLSDAATPEARKAFNDGLIKMKLAA